VADEQTVTARSQQMRQRMQRHIADRLQLATARHQGKTDAQARKAIEAAQEKFQLEAILEKGAKAGAIAIASHIAKGIHPDLPVKCVTNLAVDFAVLTPLQELGSHALPSNQSLWDATGNGALVSAAYELYLLLDCRFEGRTFANWLAGGDEDTVNAFSIGVSNDDWPSLDLLQDKCAQPATSTRSKQLYWLCDPENPNDNQAYLALVPLYPASLVHQVYLQIHADRFGEINKAARVARRERKAHDGVFHDYPGLAVQKMGGTKPQNISQLNSERGGVNYLLGSLPPVWQASPARLPAHVDSVFDKLFIARPEVRKTVRSLRQFLAPELEPNLETRQRREAYLDTLLDELVSLSGQLQQAMPAGWTRASADEDKRFQKLARAEQLWLDPLRAELPDEGDFAREWLWMDWPAEIGRRFANWLNGQLKGLLPVGDAEAREWKKVLLTDEDGFAQQLSERRKQLDAPRYIAVREGATQ